MLENTTKLDIAQLLNGKVVSSFGSSDGKTSISEDTIQLPDGRTVTVREVTDLTKRKEPTDTVATSTATNTTKMTDPTGHSHTDTSQTTTKTYRSETPDNDTSIATSTNDPVDTYSLTHTYNK